MWDDGWTVVTADGRRSAQFEHTLLVTADGAEVLTLPVAIPPPRARSHAARRPACVRLWNVHPVTHARSGRFGLPRSLMFLQCTNLGSCSR